MFGQIDFGFAIRYNGVNMYLMNRMYTNAYRDLRRVKTTLCKAINSGNKREWTAISTAHNCIASYPWVKCLIYFNAHADDSPPQVTKYTNVCMYECICTLKASSVRTFGLEFCEKMRRTFILLKMHRRSSERAQQNISEKSSFCNNYDDSRVSTS